MKTPFAVCCGLGLLGLLAVAAPAPAGKTAPSGAAAIQSLIDGVNSPDVAFQLAGVVFFAPAHPKALA